MHKKFAIHLSLICVFSFLISIAHDAEANPAGSALKSLIKKVAPTTPNPKPGPLLDKADTGILAHATARPFIISQTEREKTDCPSKEWGHLNKPTEVFKTLEELNNFVLAKGTTQPVGSFKKHERVCILKRQNANYLTQFGWAKLDIMTKEEATRHLLK